MGVARGGKKRAKPWCSERLPSCHTSPSSQDSFPIPELLMESKDKDKNNNLLGQEASNKGVSSSIGVYNLFLEYGTLLFQTLAGKLTTLGMAATGKECSLPCSTAMTGSLPWVITTSLLRLPFSYQRSFACCSTGSNLFTWQPWAAERSSLRSRRRRWCWDRSSPHRRRPQSRCQRLCLWMAARRTSGPWRTGKAKWGRKDKKLMVNLAEERSGKVEAVGFAHRGTVLGRLQHWRGGYREEESGRIDSFSWFYQGPVFFHLKFLGFFHFKKQHKYISHSPQDGLQWRG